MDNTLHTPKEMTQKLVFVEDKELLIEESIYKEDPQWKQDRKSTRLNSSHL